MTTNAGRQKWRSFTDSIKRPFVSEITPTSSDIGNMTVIGDSESLKSLFIEQVVKKELLPRRNLIPEYNAFIEQNVNEKISGPTKPQIRVSQCIQRAAGELLSTKRVSRFKSFFRKPSLVSNIISFKVFDIDAGYRKNASITYKATVTNADFILYFAQEKKGSQKVKKWIKEIVYLRKSNEIPIVVVSDKGTSIKKQCNKLKNVYLCDFTTLKMSMKDSEERNELFLERLNRVLFNAMNEYLLKKNENDRSDLIFYGE
ncbi:uncharacterized protein LOC105844042 [Hydra vulgaris]|uniref:Uncharacterized protein LOC105844042 n=1 Tax=Hydra vulgaris TaxID=6087 RepID=A0ABM4C6Z9_HYDVU